VLESAAVERLNLMPTGRRFHSLVDPERDVPPDAVAVHGITRERLAGQPVFAAILPALEAFLRDDPIVAHNAPFDFGFLDAELARLGRPALPRARMVDTLELARRRFPGLPNSLDALCRRYGIDTGGREKHNALLDVTLLAQVYLELMGGRQPGLALAARRLAAGVAASAPVARQPRPIPVSPEEAARHAAFVAARLTDPLWARLDEAG
jgi:DNA polymerase-3 subunit epsilon